MGRFPTAIITTRTSVPTLTRNWGRQSLAANGSFNAATSAQPGPYGSDPEHLFTGIDLISRSRFDRSDYGAHYQIDVTPRLRQELFAGLFWNNSFYATPFGDSYDNEYRGQLEERTVFNVTSHYTTAFGYAFSREEDKNTFIDDAQRQCVSLAAQSAGDLLGEPLRIRRTSIHQRGRARGDHSNWTHGRRPGGRAPGISAQTRFVEVNPKGSVAYALRGGTRLHASAGTGIRPPAGFDIAFTNNPRLKPERTTSFDAGIEQRLFRNRVSLDATYFYNRYYDLIVVLGGSLTRSEQLSVGQSGQLARAGRGIRRAVPAGALDLGGGIIHASRLRNPVA